MKFSEYATIVFDCDGVILDSNRVKTEAFRRAASPYGKEAADALVNYHVANGGVSRYKKFDYFLEKLAPKDIQGPDLQELLDNYAQEVKAGLLSCKIASALPELRALNPLARWVVASGGDQSELRRVFEERRLIDFFDGGIYGSPDDKIDIVAREIASGNITFPALLIGDSKYDHVVASENGLAFVFVSNWSEFSDWPTYCAENSISVFKNLEMLNEGN
ncbi:HAD family hydrolase [Pseudomonas sp. PhalM4]